MHCTTQFCVPGPFLAPVFDRLQHAKVQVSQTGVRDGLEMQIVLSLLEGTALDFKPALSKHVETWKAVFKHEILVSSLCLL